MKRSSGPRKTASLSGSIHQKLNMYALAASGAGVGMLALGQPSEAKIVYTPTHVNISPNTSYTVRLWNSVPLFTLANHYEQRRTTTGCLAYLEPTLGGAGTLAGSISFSGSGSYSFLYALSRGAQVGPQRKFQGRVMVQVGGAYDYYNGRWINVTNRYLGVRFQVNGQFHYGWARLTVKVVRETCTIHAKLTGYAFETIPNKPIIAGKTGVPDDANVEDSNAILEVPTPKAATLGVLALGSPGLSIWRREESVAKED